MKIILLLLFPLSFFLSSCLELYEHSNPVDPKSNEYKNDGTNAHLSVIGYNIKRDLSSFEKPFIIYISVINDGIGKTESSDGKLYGSIQTNPKLTFQSPFFETGSFTNTNKNSNLTDVNPKDILEGWFRFTLPENTSFPLDVNCLVRIRDRFNNTFLDSLVITIISNNDGSDAEFEITEHSIRDDFPGIFNGTKVLTVSIINKGKGSTDGEIIGTLSTTDNAVSYDVPNYSKGYFEHKETGSKYPLTINPNEILEAWYRIIVPANRTLPYNIIFELNLTDGFNNKYNDTLTVTIN